MPTTTTIGSNYPGELAGGIIGQAFKEADTIAKGLVTVLPNIPFKTSLRKISYADGRTDYACGFTPLGAVTLSEKVLEPKKIKNEVELCKEDFRQVWTSAQMGFSAHNDSMPKDENDAFIAEMMGDTAEATDRDIWQGDATVDGQFDGFVKLFNADSTVIKGGTGEQITSAAAPVTKANVIAELEKVSNAIPVALRRKTDLIFAVSPDVAQAYNLYLIEQGLANGNGGGGAALQYGSYSLTVVNGLPDNSFAVFQRKNLYFGTGLMSDHNEIRIKDMDESDLSGQVRYKQVYTAGVQYVNGEEIIYYDSTAAQV
jgi:hypothetical protein